MTKSVMKNFHDEDRNERISVDFKCVKYSHYEISSVKASYYILFTNRVRHKVIVI